MKLSIEFNENQAESQKKGGGGSQTQPASSSCFLIVFHGRVPIGENLEAVFYVPL